MALHDIEFGIVVGVDSLKVFERNDFPGHSGGWVSCSVALKLSKRGMRAMYVGVGRPIKVERDPNKQSLKRELKI